jgi:hypothetical protein
MRYSADDLQQGALMPVSAPMIACETARELLDRISPSGDHFKNPITFRDWAFRGHGDSSFRLVPSAVREGAPERLVELLRWPDHFVRAIGTPAGQAFAEATLLKRFFEVADDHGLAIPGDSPAFRGNVSRVTGELETCVQRGGAGHVIPWPDEDWVPLMALAQHDDLPTRLLDWTYSPMIAAYFAAESAVRLDQPRSETLSIWALDRHVLKACTAPMNPYEGWPGKRLVQLVVAPRASNPNLHAQSGVSTLVQVPDVSGEGLGIEGIDRIPLDEIAFRLSDEERLRNRPLFLHFTLPRSEGPEVLWLLAREGYTGARLFPGFDGVARLFEEMTHYPHSPWPWT